MIGRIDARVPARVVWSLALVVAIVWFGGLGFRKLIKADEGRYAEIPREMVVSGDWLTPRLNGLKYFEKPPLQYWATAIAYETFGVHEWTSRLWTALSGFFGIGVVGFTAARLHDRRTGLVAATVLASSLAYVLLGHFNTLDMGLTFFMTLAVCAVLLSNRTRTDRGPRGGPEIARSRTVARRWNLVAWAALAAATLSKGPVAIVLAGGALFFYAVLSRDWPVIARLTWLRGLAVFVLIAGPWFVAVSRANPSFAHFFLIHEHVERFLTTEHHREGPIWYFIPVVLVGALPWLSLLPKALRSAGRGDRPGEFSAGRLLLAYVAVVFVFFSLSGSKLPSYVLPVFPAFALLLAPTLVRQPGAVLRRHFAFVATLAVLVLVAFAVVPLDSAESPVAVATFRKLAAVAMLPWLAGTVIAAVLAGRERTVAAIVAAGVAALVGWSALVLAHETLGRGMSTFDLAGRMRPYVQADTPIYSVGTFEHTLDFYLGRTVTLVAFRDELDFGLGEEPDLGIPTLGAFIVRWNADVAPLAVMADDVFDTLSKAGLPMRIVARDGRRLVVSKPAAADPRLDASPTLPRLP